MTPTYRLVGAGHGLQCLGRYDSLGMRLCCASRATAGYASRLNCNTTYRVILRSSTETHLGGEPMLTVHWYAIRAFRLRRGSHENRIC
jgi:hypothetical protein